jgi:hypothetical protein
LSKVIYNKNGKEEKSMGFREDIKIDKSNLDSEWMLQAVRFVEWGEKEVEAQFQKDSLKEQLDLVRADLDSKIRSTPAAYGIDKITEGALMNTIIRQPEYLEASSNYLKAVKDAKVLSIAREAFDHKKRALEKLTDLWISGYWADPRIRSEAKGIMTEEARASHLETLNKNPRLRRRLRGG